jgi:nitrite reductase/ring-hydroxylating ferredoxin subunit
VSRRALCRVEEIAEGGARGFCFGSGPDFAAVLVVKRAGALYAYVNSCPHLGTPLDFLPERFLDRDGRHLLCATHGARFRIEDGYCLDGPCAGKSLKKAAIRVEAGIVALAERALS